MRLYKAVLCCDLVQWALFSTSKCKKNLNNHDVNSTKVVPVSLTKCDDDTCNLETVLFHV